MKTCLETSSGEDVLDCIKNILNSMGQGDCGACICDVFPQACLEKEEIPEGLRVSDIKEKDPEVEIRSDGGVECYRCTYYVQGEFDVLKEICSSNFFFQVHFKLACTLLTLMSQ